MKVPFFGDLPVLGWLFKSRRENDDRSEILVFITPKITNRSLLRCQ
jgi:type IV pilus assembly protein PilQ